MTTFSLRNIFVWLNLNLSNFVSFMTFWVWSQFKKAIRLDWIATFHGFGEDVIAPIVTGNEISNDHVFILSTVIKWLQRITIAFLEWILKTTGAKAKKNAHHCWPLSTYHYQLSRRKLTQYWNIILWRSVVIFVNRHPLPSLARQPCFPQEVGRCWIGGESDKPVMQKYASEGIHPGFETQRRFSQKPKIR